MITLLLTLMCSAIINVDGYGDTYEQQEEDARFKACGQAYGFDLRSSTINGKSYTSVMCRGVSYNILKSSEIGSHRTFTIEVNNNYYKHTSKDISYVIKMKELADKNRSMENKMFRRALAVEVMSLYNDNNIDIIAETNDDNEILISYKVSLKNISTIASNIKNLYKQAEHKNLNYYKVYFSVTIRVQCSSSIITGYINSNGDIIYNGFYKSKASSTTNNVITGKFVMNKGMEACVSKYELPIVKISFGVSGDEELSQDINNLTKCLPVMSQDSYTIDYNGGMLTNDRYEWVHAYRCNENNVVFMNRYEINNGNKNLTYSKSFDD